MGYNEPLPGYGLGNAVLVPVAVDYRFVYGGVSLLGIPTLDSFISIFAETAAGSGVYVLVQQPKVPKGVGGVATFSFSFHVEGGCRYYFLQDPLLSGTVAIYNFVDVKTYLRPHFTGAPP